jgi:glycosyltransferase involved in cell wall biosynthesis
MQGIAFLTTNFFFNGWGGSEELWFRTAQRMAELGYKVGVNIYYWKDIPQQIKILNQTQGCEVSQHKVTFWRRTAKKLLSEKQQAYIGFDVYGWLKRFQPELVVISQIGNLDGRDWMQACHSLNIPYVTIAHLADELLWLYPYQTHTTDLFKKALATFFVSKRSIEVTSKQLATHLENARLIYNPFQVDYDVDIPWPEDESVLRLACVARLGIEHKRQDILLEIMRQPKWRNRPITITLFGNGFHKESLQKLKELWQVHNVLFGGFSQNIQAVWSQHHALILPSQYEGCPLAVVEAMLCDRPCIVTDVGGNSELIQDGVSGFIAPATTVSIVEKTLDLAWERRHEWKDMGKNAGLRIREIIPRDPVAYFIDELRSLIRSEG